MARHDNCEIGHSVTDAYDKDQLERAAAPSMTSKISEDEIDRNLIGTFPASDPPSWTLGVERERHPAGDGQENKKLLPRK